jgi:hypothetical protein
MASRITMNPAKNQLGRIPETNKVPGLPYIFTDTGLELPVLDITHPLFEESIDENSLAGCPFLSMGIAGSCLLDRETIDPTITALAKISSATLRYLGREGLEDILEATSWLADWFDKTANPVYLLFSLRKR